MGRSAFFTTLVAVACVVVSGLRGYTFTLDSLQSQFAQKLRLLADERHMRLLAYTEQQYERAELIASRTRFRRYLLDGKVGRIEREEFVRGTRPILDDARQCAAGIIEITTAAPDGKVLTGTTGASLGDSIQMMDVFRTAKRTQTSYLSDPTLVDGRLVCRLAVPLYDEMEGRREFTAVLVVMFDASPLDGIMTPPVSMGRTARLVAARREGDGLAPLLPTQTLPQSDPAVRALLGHSINDGSGFECRQWEGREVLAAWRPMQFRPGETGLWGLTAIVDRDEAFAMTAEFKRDVYLLLASVIIVSILLSLIGARRLTAPLVSLTNAVEALADDRQPDPVLVARNDDVRRLADAFNHMAHRLGLSQLKYRSSNADLVKANTKFKDQLDLAAEIQHCLYPSTPLIVPGYEIKGRVESAERLCGDYYDYFPTEEGRFVVALGDVSGHGVGPALMMAVTRAIIRSLAASGRPMDDWSAYLNLRLYHDSPEGRFVSLFIAEIDPDRQMLRYMGAGHEGQIVRRDGTIELLQSTGFLLGLELDMPYEIKQCPFRSGDLLFIGTDGINETRNSEGKLFGRERMMSIVQSMQSALAEKTLQALIDATAQHRGDRPSDDDLTALIVRSLAGAITAPVAERVMTGRC